jgi:uncharacterized membrane protein
MTELLFLGLVILGFLLLDTRGRLARLERQLREQQFPMGGEELPRATQAERPWRSAVIVDQPPQEAPEAESEAPAPPEPISAPEPVQMLRVEPEEKALVAPLAAPQMPPAPAEPVVTAETQAEATAPSGYQPASFSFEDLFGRKLPIWAGGITLVVAAVLLVKYSVDAGLLAPFVRVLFGLLFGALLIGGAELARRREDLVQDPRISQALSGAGIGSLYTATLAAANLYGLIGPGTAFAGLAAITALAMLLATRFGAPSAVLGLVGGLATPAVIQSGAPNVPLLTGYIAVVVGGLTLLSRRQRWMWLGVSALIGGAGWSLVMILMGGLGQVSMLSVGLLVLLLGVGLPLFQRAQRPAAARRFRACRLAPACPAGGDGGLCPAKLGPLRAAFHRICVAQRAGAEAAAQSARAAHRRAGAGGLLAPSAVRPVFRRDRGHHAHLWRRGGLADLARGWQPDGCSDDRACQPWRLSALPSPLLFRPAGAGCTLCGPCRRFCPAARAGSGPWLAG